eukprot:gene597-2020_t
MDPGSLSKGDADECELREDDNVLLPDECDSEAVRVRPDVFTPFSHMWRMCSPVSGSGLVSLQIHTRLWGRSIELNALLDCCGPAASMGVQRAVGIDWCFKATYEGEDPPSSMVARRIEPSARPGQVTHKRNVDRIGAFTKRIRRRRHPPPVQDTWMDFRIGMNKNIGVEIAFPHPPDMLPAQSCPGLRRNHSNQPARGSDAMRTAPNSELNHDRYEGLGQEG